MTTGDPITSAVDIDDLRRLIRIRMVEELLLRLFSEGKVRGTTHTSIGQEAIAVGVIACLDRERDTVFSNHRGHGHYIAYTGDVEGLLAELMGREGAVCGGMGGSQHLHAPNYYSNGIQGGVPGVATGIGLAHRLDGRGAVSVAFLGDGTFGEGLTYEALNMASLWSLPVLYVVEDNRIAQSTPAEWNRSGSLVGRFRAFDIEAIEIDGQDVGAVRQAAADALDHLRAGRGPYGLVLRTIRLAPHSKGDDPRTEAELTELRRRDPIDLAVARHDGWRELRATIEAEERAALESLVADLDARAPAPGFAVHRPVPGAPPGGDGRAFEGTVAERLNAAIAGLMAGDARVLVIGEDIADPYGGAFKITRGITSRFPDRAFTTPISEAGIMALANGLALRGYRPIVEMMFGDFMFLAADQVVNHAAKFQSMYGRRLDLSCVVRTPMGGRRGYGPTHSQSTEKFFMGLPGLAVVAVNHLADPAALLEWAVADANQPVLFVENKLLYPKKHAAPDERFRVRIEPDDRGPRLVAIEPANGVIDVVLACYGGMAPEALAAAVGLAAEEVGVLVLVPELVSPLSERLVDAIRRAGAPLVVLEESTADFGWGAELLGRLTEENVRVGARRIGAAGDCIPAAIHLEEAALPRAADIRARILEMLT